LHRLFPPKAQALGFVEPGISATGNQQPQFVVTAKLCCLDSKKQALAVPSRAREQERDLIWL
jgi:hypothetical protein